MAKKPGSKQNPSATGDTGMDGNVDQIREILFGGQMRDYEQRFANLEMRMNDTIDKLSRRFEKRIEQAIAQSRKDVDKITEQLKSERKERLSEYKQSVTELENLTNHVEAWFAEIDEQFDAESKELRAALRNQADELTTLLSETRSAAESKVDTESLARLLGEFADKLRKQAR